MKRRKIGPAYERAPAEKIGEWSTRNSLTLVSGVVIVAIYWWLVNISVDHLFNFLASGGEEGAEIVYYSDHPLALAAKIIGGLLIILILVKTRTK